MLLQVATEWLFSVPDHILHKHLASDPNTPVAEVSTPEDHRVFAPRRVPLQVATCFRRNPPMFVIYLGCPQSKQHLPGMSASILTMTAGPPTRHGQATHRA